MNEETKTILNKFFLTSVILLSLTMVAVGFVIVGEKSEQMSHDIDYAVISIDENENNINLIVDEESYSLNTSKLEEFKQLINSLWFTPVSFLTYFVQSVAEIF